MIDKLTSNFSPKIHRIIQLTLIGRFLSLLGKKKWKYLPKNVMKIPLRKTGLLAV